MAKERQSSKSELEKKENNCHMLKTRKHVHGKEVVCESPLYSTDNYKQSTRLPKELQNMEV